MAGTSQTGGESVSETFIPIGLNRIKTARVSLKGSPSSRRGDDADNFFDSRTCGVGSPQVKQKLKLKLRSMAQGYGKPNGSREGQHKGKITRWFRSHFSKGSGRDLNDSPPNIECGDSEDKGFGEEGPKTKLHKVGPPSTVKKSSPESTCTIEVPEILKSFLNALGPKGGIRSVHPRAHSYNEFKELLRSLCTSFDSAKRVVNMELVCFSGDVMELMQKNDFSSPDEQKLVVDLLILCQRCVEMKSSEFRAKCATIVQDLTEKRKLCQTGWFKCLLTRMLFILTRCTRLLHFESEPIDEKSLHKFRKCLESVPSVDMSWEPDHPVLADSGPAYASNLMRFAKQELQDQNKVSSLPEATSCRFELPDDECNKSSKKDFMIIDQNSSYPNSQFDVLSTVQEYHQVDRNYPGDSVDKASCCLRREQEQSLDGSDLVICRICEEVVPTLRLESHSYICAYAEKCNLKCLDLDDHLSKLAEMLELLIESLSLGVHASNDSPESSRTQISNPTALPEANSPKISERRSKGVKGMFEDLHEMDTACIDDSHVTTTNLMAHLGLKLSNCGPPSLAGSITSASSPNTPRPANFDFLWQEHNHSELLEDMQQMTALVDIARCVAGTDLSKDESREFLLSCMESLQDVLDQCKIEALVVDTFGGRIENLLR
ncbi:hypothetical protein U1Q18_005799 [Sarracenia purpurea var. burkii]